MSSVIALIWLAHINFLYSSSCYPPDAENQQLIGSKKDLPIF